MKDDYDPDKLLKWVFYTNVGLLVLFLVLVAILGSVLTQ